jgi:uracil-DNA glycosylase family 4
MCRCRAGAHEKLKPFVGKSRKRIDVGFGDRTDMFITNVRKCNAYDKDKDEREASIAHCAVFLQAEMDAIDKMQKEAGVTSGGVIGIGSDAAKVLVGRGNMAKLHGTVYTRKERDAMAMENERDEHEEE